MTDLCRVATLSLLSLCASAMTAHAQVAPPAPTSAAAPQVFSSVPTEDGYVLGVGDVISSSVLGRTEFNSQVQVQADGTLQLPFLGTVKAADLSVLQFRENIRNALKKGGFYADPVVNIAVTTYASRYVIVLGEVGQPGMVSVDRNYRVSEILAKVGGPRASGAEYISLRRASGEETKLDINTLATGTLEQDPFVKPGDKLFVPKAETFYIYGQISRAGTLKIEPGMTLLKAIATAGGVTTMGSMKRIKITRDGKEIKKFSLTGLIKNGDVIYVGERFF